MSSAGASEGRLKTAFRFVLNQCLFLLSYLVPHRKGMIVLGSGLGRRFMGNPKYVYLKLLENRESGEHLPEFYWITENEDICRDFRARGWPVLDKFSLRGFWSLLRAEFLVVESGMMSTQVLHDVGYAWLLLGRFNVIQTWHGTALKLICLDSLRDRGVNTLIERLFYRATRLEYSSFDCVVGQSDYDAKVFASAFSSGNVPVLGSPRNDVFSHQFPQHEGLEERFGLSGFERVILYAPTYREARASVMKGDVFRHLDEPLKPFSDEFLESFNRTCVDRNWLMLVKKHHLDTALVIKDELTNIIDVGPVEDIQELLLHADVLVTDYSSVFFDFLQADRPIIYYVYDLESYVGVRGMYMDFSSNIIGPFARDEGEVARLLDTADTWFHEPEYRGKFNTFRRRFQKFPEGGGCERVIRYMQLRSGGSDPVEAGLRASESH